MKHADETWGWVNGILVMVIILPLALSGAVQAAGVPPSFANVQYGPSPHQIMDIYIPPKGKGPFPVLLWYGNLWVAGKAAPYRGLPDLRPLFKAHCAMISVEMRTMTDAVKAGVNPPISYPLLDACRAVQFVRLHAARWKINPARIAVGGESQGALPALFVDSGGQRADPLANDPVARVSTRVVCALAWRGQPSIDPKHIKRWVPGVQWGAPAFGCSFAKSLQRRKELLPEIKRWSPDWLLHKGIPPIYMGYNYHLNAVPKWDLQKGGRMDFLVHNPRWGIEFQKLARKHGVTCYLQYPGHRSARCKNLWNAVIRQLTAPTQ